MKTLALALLAAALVAAPTRAQTPEQQRQMEYERQQRESWRAQEQQRLEQQRQQQLMNENARRQQDESRRAMQGSGPGAGLGGGSALGGSGGGAVPGGAQGAQLEQARQTWLKRPPLAPQSNPLIGIWTRLPPPNCAVKVDATLPGPDIVGLKLGMSRDDALNFARCLDKDTFVSFEGTWIQGLRSHGVKLAPQVFVSHAGESRPCKYSSMDEMNKCGAANRAWTHVSDKITVVSPGVPGRKRVLGIWREQHFKSGEMPTAGTPLPALVQKYGPPQVTQQHTNNWMRMDWLHDASGTPLAQSQRGPHCRSISARGHESHSWSDACGLTITALVVLSPENPLLAKELNVGMLHQQQLYRTGQSLRAQLQAIEQQRRQQEAEQGNEAAANVKL